MARTSPSRFRLGTVVRTRSPAARSCRMEWLPMKPDPPVTKTVLIGTLTWRGNARSPDSTDIDLPGPRHHALPLRTEFGDTEFDHVARFQVLGGRFSAHSNTRRCPGGD